MMTTKALSSSSFSSSYRQWHRHCRMVSFSSFSSSMTRKEVATAAAFTAPHRHHPSHSFTLSNRGRIAVKMSTSGNSNETENQSSSSSSSSSARAIKILCLHGKYENGNSFLNRALLPLRRTLEERLEQKCPRGQRQRQLSIQWEELTAPFPIDPKSAPFSNEDVERGFQWWTLPKGVRSFEATEYGGFEQSEQLVLDKLLSSNSNNNDNGHYDDCKSIENGNDGSCSNNYDIVLGHSQGAILLSALLARNEVLRNIPTPLPSNYNKEEDKKQKSHKMPMAYILNGAAWPNPYNSELLALSKHNNTRNDNDIDNKHQNEDDRGEDNNISSHPKILFLMSKNDPINPTSSAQKVCETYRTAGFDVSVVTHNGGHAVPMPKRIGKGNDDGASGDAKNSRRGDDDDAQRALVEVADWIIDNVVVVKMQ
mmetsp:Transcript_19188/g.39124  ORF Transcript_19188/g.39124 Transcript_19188/m.39124 type:complete len:425 (+) Transcript_19188:408-1682(+)